MDHGAMTTSYTHMTFFWGTNSDILFSGWPGPRPAMYALALLLVLLLAFFLESLRHLCRSISSGSEGGGAARGLLCAALHALTAGAAYLLMLALMSFNVGVFLAAIAGHALGFWVFGRRGGGPAARTNRAHPSMSPVGC